MWIFLNDAMFSLVEDRKDKMKLVCRARIKGDIERVFPGADVKETTDSDYRFRAWLDRDMVATQIAQEVKRINYDNFKNSIPKEDKKRHDAYLGVWAVMNRLQEELYGLQEWWLDYKYKTAKKPKIEKKKNWQK